MQSSYNPAVTVNGMNITSSDMSTKRRQNSLISHTLMIMHHDDDDTTELPSNTITRRPIDGCTTNVDMGEQSYRNICNNGLSDIRRTSEVVLTSIHSKNIILIYHYIIVQRRFQSVHERCSIISTNQYANGPTLLINKLINMLGTLNSILGCC